MKFYILINGEEQQITDAELDALWQQAISTGFSRDIVLEFDELVRNKFGADARMLGSEQ
jgi:hypothetical protein